MFLKESKNDFQLKQESAILKFLVKFMLFSILAHFDFVFHPIYI